MESDLIALIGLIPEQYAPYVALVAQGIFAFSVLAGALKLVLGDPKPTDAGWKRAFFQVAQWLDFLALNTATVRSKRKVAALKQDVKTLSTIYPPPFVSSVEELEEVKRG